MRFQGEGIRTETSFAGPVPAAIRSLLIASVVVYVLQIIPGLGPQLVAWGALVARDVFGGGQVWRLVSYLFLHDPFDPLHLAFNMLSLWMFGAALEEQWGSRRFLAFYIVNGVAAALFSIFFWEAPIIGASGAVMAVLTAYAWYFPRQTIYIFFIFPAPVWLAVAIFGAVSLWGSFGSGGGIAHITHLGGILSALIWLFIYDRAKSVPETILNLTNTWKKQSAEKSEQQRKDRFGEVIDPILKKISEQGMDALTDKERIELEKIPKKRKSGSGENIIKFTKKKK